jgi:hypothetical protein
MSNAKIGLSLTGIAAVLTAILGTSGIAGFLNKENTSTSPISSPTNVKTEKLTVNAKSITGEIYENEEEKTVNINFKATGKWLAIPESLTQYSASGYITAKGFPAFPSNDQNIPCPRYPLAALVIVGENNECLASGDEGSFKLKKQEKVYFLMNDVKSHYDDNDGSISVDLSIK